MRSARLPPLKAKGQKHEKENHRVQTKSRQTKPDPPTASLHSDSVAQLVAAYLLGRRDGLCTFDSYATGKRIQQLRKANGMTQEEMAIRLNISDRHLGRIERGECAASIDLMVEVVVLLKANLDFLIIGVTETPRERDLIAHIKKQNKTIRMFKDGLNTLITELTETEIA